MNLRKVLMISGLMLGLGLLANLGLPKLLPWQAPAALPPELGPSSAILPQRGSTTQINQLTARPLFWSSRRPPPPATAEAQPPQGPAKEEFPKEVKLLGLYGSGPASGALIREGKQIKRIPLGSASLRGWKLIEVKDQSALFASPRGSLLHSLPLADRPPPNRR